MLRIHPQYANEYVRPINGLMEGLHLNPTAASVFNVQGNAVIMPDGLSLVVDGIHSYMPLVGGNVMAGHLLILDCSRDKLC